MASAEEMASSLEEHAAQAENLKDYTVRKVQPWTPQYTTHANGNGKEEAARADNGRAKKASR